MRSPYKQRGAGFFGLLMWLMVGAFGFIFFMKVMPVYLNEQKVKQAVNKVATSGVDERTQMIKDLDKFWIIDDIKYLTPQDIVIRKTGDGSRIYSYEYEVQEPLFSNISILIQFKNEIKD